MWSTPAVWKQYIKMAVLHFFLVNSPLIYILFSKSIYLSIYLWINWLIGRMHQGIVLQEWNMPGARYFNIRTQSLIQLLADKQGSKTSRSDMCFMKNHFSGFLLKTGNFQILIIITLFGFLYQDGSWQN